MRMRKQKVKKMKKKGKEDRDMVERICCGIQAMSYILCLF